MATCAPEVRGAVPALWAERTAENSCPASHRSANPAQAPPPRLSWALGPETGARAALPPPHHLPQLLLCRHLSGCTLWILALAPQTHGPRAPRDPSELYTDSRSAGAHLPSLPVAEAGLRPHRTSPGLSLTVSHQRARTVGSAAGWAHPTRASGTGERPDPRDLPWQTPGQEGRGSLGRGTGPQPALPVALADSSQACLPNSF